MLHETPTHVQSLDHEQLAADAQRLADLFSGAVALLQGDCPPSAVHAARGTLLEARALVTSLVECHEGMAARKAEADRAERLHREESVRIASAGGVR